MDFVCSLAVFIAYFEFVQVGVKCSSITGSCTYYKLHAHKSRHEIKQSAKPPPPNGLPMFCTSFVMYFKSVRVSVKVSSTTGSSGYYKLRAYKNEARNVKSVWNTPNGFYTLPNSFWHAFRICLSQCYCLLHNGLFYRYYKLRAYEIEARYETECQTPEWTLWAH